MESPSARVASIYREESGLVLARLIRLCGGNFDAAEEAFHDAVEAALAAWPREGFPESPRGWLWRTARNKAVDAMRRRARLEAIVREGQSGDEPSAPSPDEPESWPRATFEDDRLRLVFTCCNPALSVEAQVALTLRTLCGLSTEEIARAFLVSVPTMAQRLVRAKQKISVAKIPYRIPEAEELGERLEAVCAVVYLVFTEGYAATQGDALIRRDLTNEAIRLGRLLVGLLPQRAEPKSLLALMLLHDARKEARTDAQGDVVLLEEQDRSRWDQGQIAEGTALLDAAIQAGGKGPYEIQAAIASLHARAPRAEDTDWRQIALLYERLFQLAPSPVVALNHAVAVAQAHGIGPGRAALESLSQTGALEDYHLFHAAKAELHRREERWAEARAAYEAALRLATNEAERRHLRRRITEISERELHKTTTPPESHPSDSRRIPT